MKRVKLKSRQDGWRGLIRDNYETYAEFEAMAQTYNLHGRLGYKTPKQLWDDNPIVQGGINPADFEKVKYSEKRRNAIIEAADRIAADISLNVSSIREVVVSMKNPISKKDLRQLEKDIDNLKLCLKMLSQ